MHIATLACAATGSPTTGASAANDATEKTVSKPKQAERIKRDNVLKKIMSSLLKYLMIWLLLLDTYCSGQQNT